MFKLFTVKARLISKLGHIFTDEELVRATSLEEAIIAGLKVFTSHGEEMLWVEAALA